MKRIIAIALSLVMALSSIAVVAAPTDRAQAAMDYIEVFTDGEGTVEIRDMGVETLVGKNTPDVHEVEVSRNTPVNFVSTLDMQLVEEVFAGMKYALTLESAETQALFADAELDGQFVITIDCDEDIDYSAATKEFTNLESTIFADPVYTDTVVTVDTADGLLLEDLDTTLLHDISYSVEGAKSGVVGRHEVAVRMTGSVDLVIDDTVVGTIDFSTKTSGEDHKAAIVVRTSGGGGAIRHTVKFETNGGSKLSSVQVFDKQKLTLPTAPTKDGYTFAGWYTDADLTTPFDADKVITKDITLYAKWTTGEDVGDDDTADVIVKGENDKEVDTDENIKISDLEVPERDGFIFGGWYEDPGYNNQLEDDYVIEAGDKVYGRWVNVTVPDALEDTDHFAYIIGYPDETVRPQRNVSREEVATMFYRLMKPDYRAEKLTRENDFPDIEEGRWSEKAVATMANAGFIKGYPEGDFRPENSITRAEFATIAARMFADDYDRKYEGKFTDIAGHWAEEDILKLSAYECIYGYENGSFKPDAKITRAEAIAIINRIIVRYVNHEGLHKYAIHWVDNVKGNWYYYPMLEATNSHDYKRQEDLYNEDWHQINANIDWEADQYN
ncbi:MAG: S-layer homology domain-containing protein [Clostridia bacterium]|nr:S-layer homology domain-containing protein [Clostridia bacterium]